jgi:hypothetical protein
MDELGQLRRLVAALEGGQPAPPDVAVWLGDALREYLRRGGEVSLERLLGLRRPGQESLAMRLARERRNAALLVAGEFAHDGRPCSREERGVILVRAARAFEASRKWRRWRDLEAPPESATPLERQLFAALKAGGGKLPKSPRYLAALARLDYKPRPPSTGTRW